MSQIQEKLEHFKEWQKRIEEKSLEVNTEVANYKAEFKREFGFADGEQTHALQMVEIITKVLELSK